MTHLVMLSLPELQRLHHCMQEGQMICRDTWRQVLETAIAATQLQVPAPAPITQL